MSVCRSCGAEIIWATTPAGKPMPLDPERVPGGNIDVEVVNGDWTARVVPSDVHTERHVTHFVSCPQAAAHRQSRDVP